MFKTVNIQGKLLDELRTIVYIV